MSLIYSRQNGQAVCSPTVNQPTVICHIVCVYAEPYFVFLSVANLLEVVLTIMIYYARWQHKLKTSNVKLQQEMTTKKQILTYAVIRMQLHTKL